MYHILIADDEQAERECIRYLIEQSKLPLQISEATDGLYALEILEQAPVHILIIPKQHIPSAAYINETNSALVAHIFEVAARLAKEMKLDNGFRIVNNCGDDAGQTVHHLHFHLLGGSPLGLTFGSAE